MARPGRQGVDYFPLDVHLDNKMKFLIIKFGLEGLGAIITIFQEIYANGYWCKWEEDEKLIFTHENNISLDRLDNIVAESIDREIFNKELFEKYNILTSSGIQKRYNKIVERRKDVEIIEEYLLIDNKFGVNPSIMSTRCEHDVDIEGSDSKQDDNKSTQSKVKESKVEDNKEEASETEERFQEESLEYQLSEELYKKILLNDDKVKKPNLHKWAEHIDKLMRLDKRSEAEIREVVEFATLDPFWQSNILSTSSLRKQFSKLIIQSRQRSGKFGGHNKNGGETYEYDYSKFVTEA